MGTRHLLVVQLDDEYRLAQYGQFDGYPSGRGVELLNILKTTPRKKFEANLRRCRCATPEELTAMDNMTPDAWDAFVKAAPQWARQTSVGIIPLICATDEGLTLHNQITFAADSLFCEWCYVLDLDHDVLEVYKGFNKTKLTPYDRFYFLTVIADANPSGINLDIGGEVRLAEGPDDRHDAEQQTGQANRHSLHPAESHPEGHHHQPGRDCHPADRGDRQQCSPNRLHPDRKGAQSFGRRA